MSRQPKRGMSGGVPQRVAPTTALAPRTARQVKAAGRNLWWRVRGWRLQNPPLPARVQSIVFVCLGNICRSPFAAVIAERGLSAAGVDVRCTSAGLRPSQDGASPGEARRAGRTFGVSLDAHRPQPLTGEMIKAHDLVVVMEAGQLEQLRAEYPHHRDRFCLLSLYDPVRASGFARYNIADPFGSSLEVYQTCYQRIERAVTSLLEALPSPIPARRPASGGRATI